MEPELEVRLRAVWEHGSPIGGPAEAEWRTNERPWRYVPKANGGAGGGWDVWDMKASLFLSERQVLKLPLDRLQNELFAN